MASPVRAAAAAAVLHGAPAGAVDSSPGRPAARAGFLSRAGGALRRVPVLGVALGGLGIAGALAQGNRAGAVTQAGGLAGGVGGAAAGGLIGGALGSVVPVLGTSIGAAIGSALGSYFGAGLGADQAASALERAAGMDAETRDGRRREARRRWQEEADGAGRGR